LLYIEEWYWWINVKGNVVFINMPKEPYIVIWNTRGPMCIHLYIDICLNILKFLQAFHCPFNNCAVVDEFFCWMYVKKAGTYTGHSPWTDAYIKAENARQTRIFSLNIGSSPLQNLPGHIPCKIPVKIHHFFALFSWWISCVALYNNCLSSRQTPYKVGVPY